MKIEIPEHLVIDVLELIKKDKERFYESINKKHIIETVATQKFEHTNIGEYRLINQANEIRYLTYIKSTEFTLTDIIANLTIGQQWIIDSVPLALILRENIFYKILPRACIKINLFKDNKVYEEVIDLWADLVK